MFNSLSILKKIAHGRIALATSILIVAIVSYLFVQDKVGVNINTYQPYFSSAVMHACGHGFVRPKNNADIPGLNAFLNRKSTIFDCSAIPTTIRTQPASFFQKAYKYLMLSVSYIWQYTDISWDNLRYLQIILFVLFALSLYALFHTLSNVPTALILTFCTIFLYSSIGTIQLIREFSKAPFILFATAVLIILYKKIKSNSSIILLSALYGFIISIGMGFRREVFLYTFPFILFILYILISYNYKESVKKAFYSIFGFCFTFAIFGLPILTAFKDGGNNLHLCMLGLADNFTESLGLTKISYTVVPKYNDGVVLEIITAYFNNMGNEIKNFYLNQLEYTKHIFKYIINLLNTIPFDLIKRPLSSFIFCQNIFITDIFNLTPHSIFMLSGTILFAVNSILILLRSINLGIIYIITNAFYCCYPSLLFQERNYFHLIFVQPLNILLCINFLANSVKKTSNFYTKKRVFKLAIFISSLALLTGSVGYTSYKIQEKSLSQYTSKITGQILQPLQDYSVSKQKNEILLTFTPTAVEHFLNKNYPPGGLRARALVAVIKVKRLPSATANSVTITTHMTSPDKYLDRTTAHVARFNDSCKSSHVFMPVIFIRHCKFQGISLSHPSDFRVAEIRFMSPKAFPVFLWIDRCDNQVAPFN